MLSYTRPPPELELEAEPIQVTLPSLRMIDRIWIRARGIPFDLYSFGRSYGETAVVTPPAQNPLSPHAKPDQEPIAPDEHVFGDIIVLPEMEEYLEMEKIKENPLNYMFSADEDVYAMQQHRIGNDFNTEYAEAVEAYLDGEWDFAAEALEKCLKIDPEDGPAQELKRFIVKENNCQVPEKWMGYRLFMFEDVSRTPFGDSEGSANYQEEGEDEEASESEA